MTSKMMHEWRNAMGNGGVGGDRQSDDDDDDNGDNSGCVATLSHREIKNGMMWERGGEKMNEGRETRKKSVTNKK